MGNGARVRFCVQYGIFAVLLLAGTAKVALAQTASSHVQPIRDLKVSDIFVPTELGYIVEINGADTSAGSPIIVHIQEAHTNYEAQQHLVAILENLIQHHGLRLILVEGGHGDVSLAHLRTYGSPANRQDVAERYLKAGIISGEEYLDIVSDYSLVLWGVEEPGLYQANLDAFMEAEELRESVGPILQSIGHAVEVLRPKLADPALIELETKVAAFEAHQLGLGDYADYLIVSARRQGLDEAAYPNLSQFRTVRMLEQQLDLPAVQEEQRGAIGTISQQVEPAALDAFIASATALKEGTMTREDYFVEFQDLAADAGVDLTSYPNLFTYMRYVKRSAALEPTALSVELTQLAGALRMRLATTHESRRLNQIAEELRLTQNLVRLRLSPAEYAQLRTLTLVDAFAEWEKFLTKELVRQGEPVRAFSQLRALATAVPTLLRFYETANERDQVLVENALAKLNETGEPLAVLITGGFHSPQITKLLSARGVGTVVVAPKVTRPTNERLYHAVLKYKSGHGSFDEVMAIANESAD